MPAYRTNARSSALEVATEVPLPPTLSLISPTPRAFTFPNPASPFASPSSSPFEPDFKPLRLITPPAIPRLLSPESAASASSPVFSSPTSSYLTSPVSPVRPRSRSREARESAADAAAPAFKRRKSTGGVAEPAERRPKRGDDDYVKRPENAFILFRRKCVEERLAAQAAADEEAAAAAAAADGAASKPKKHRQADLSKMISQQWRALGPEERTFWEERAKDKKREHERLHPDYVYRPQRVKKAAAKSGGKAMDKGKGRADGDDGELEPEESLSFVLPAPASPPGRHGRSNSAPNAPVGGAQTIRLPVVNMPSAPSSPLLLPSLPLNAIGRRPSAEWMRPAVHRPLEAQTVQGLFQPQYMMQADEPMHYQQTPQFFPGMFEISAPAPMDTSSLAPLMLPPTYFPGTQLISPADSMSPLSAYPSPFTPVSGIDWTRLSISSQGTDASDVSDAASAPHPFFSGAEFAALPDLYEQPWAFEFVGEYVPGGADFLSDDSFDLSKIPQVALEELCPEPMATTMRCGGAPALQDGGAPAHGQDPFAALFYPEGAQGRF